MVFTSKPIQGFIRIIHNWYQGVFLLKSDEIYRFISEGRFLRLHPCSAAWLWVGIRPPQGCTWNTLWRCQNDRRYGVKRLKTALSASPLCWNYANSGFVWFFCNMCDWDSIWKISIALPRVSVNRKGRLPVRAAHYLTWLSSITWSLLCCWNRTQPSDFHQPMAFKPPHLHPGYGTATPSTDRRVSGYNAATWPVQRNVLLTTSWYPPLLNCNNRT